MLLSFLPVVDLNIFTSRLILSRTCLLALSLKGNPLGAQVCPSCSPPYSNISNHPWHAVGASRLCGRDGSELRLNPALNEDDVIVWRRSQPYCFLPCELGKALTSFWAVKWRRESSRFHEIKSLHLVGSGTLVWRGLQRLTDPMCSHGHYHQVESVVRLHPALHKRDQ